MATWRRRRRRRRWWILMGRRWEMDAEWKGRERWGN
jgi:hypothetical protein